jgi:hypothetical protein
MPRASMYGARRGTLLTQGSAARGEKIRTEESPEEKRKRQFDFMTSDVLKERQKNMLASTYFKAWNDRVFLFSAFITLVQAGLASTANLYSELIQSKINITIALLAAFSVFWQSFVKHWDYGGKASLHEAASSALEKIYNIALLRARDETANLWYATTDGGVGNIMEITASPAEDDAAGSGKVEEGATTTTDTKSNASDEEYEDNNSRGSSNQLKTLTKQFEQAIEGCSSQVPVQISAAFAALETRIGICKRDVVFDKDDEKACTKVRWEKGEFRLFQK